jgi:hypothetical protein
LSLGQLIHHLVGTAGADQLNEDPTPGMAES